ncbi:MAG: hypothetical protein KGI26_07080 [Thaumarchaeota archaeon]|nr:hypothetical protein [Nitrososphaerota archaeon]
MKRLLSLAIAALLVASSFPLPAYSSGITTVTATVKSSSSLAAVAGATVTYFNATTRHKIISGVTDASGTFATFINSTGATIVTVNATGFKNWQAPFSVPKNGTSFTAKVIPNTVPITINAASTPFAIGSASAYLDGALTTLPATEAWVMGSTHNVTAPLSLPYGSGNSSRWGFASWSGGVSTATRKLSISVTGAETLTENFGLQYALTVQFNKTRGLVSPTTGYLAYGASVSVSASPAAGWLFANWTLDSAFVSTVNPLPLTMTQPHTLLATFKLASTTVAFQVSGQTSVPAKVDGNAVTFPQTYSWAPGSKHTVVIYADVALGAGSRAALTTLTLGGSTLALANFTITVPSSPSTYALAYQTEYYLGVSSSDSHAVVAGSGWYAKGSTVPLTAPAKVLLADGSALILQSYSLDGTLGNGASLSVTMSAPHAVAWNYAHFFKLSVAGIANDQSDLGASAYFVVQPPTGQPFQMANHNSTFLPSAVYSIQMFYGGEVANTTRLSLTASVSLQVVVNNYGVEGQFNFKVVGGFLTSASLSSTTLTIQANGKSATLRVFIPPGVYAQDFFTVTGVTNSTFEQAQRLLLVSISGATTVVIGTPAGQVFSLSTSTNSGSGEVVQGTLGGQVVSQFSAFCGTSQNDIGVNFQTPTSQLGVESAVPFESIFDPNHQYSLTFGYCTNGAVLVAVLPSSQMTFAKVFQSPQYGALVEISPINAPTTNPTNPPLTILRSTGAGDNVYEVDMLGATFGSFFWTISSCGASSCADLYVSNLNNVVVTSATATAFNKTILAVQDSLGAIAFAFVKTSYGSAQVVIYGTAPVTIKSLPSGKFGPQQITFEPLANANQAVSCASGTCHEVSGVMGGYGSVTVNWKAIPTGGSFNVTINGVLVMVNGNQLCAKLRNTSSTTQPGIDLNQCVVGAPSQGTSGDGFFSFTPQRDGQYVVCVTSKTFAGTYQGCAPAVYADPNGTLSSAEAGLAVVGVFVGMVFIARKRKRPGASVTAMGKAR